MLFVAIGDQWYRRAYAGTADLKQPVIVSDVFEAPHPESGRMDWQIAIDGERPMLAGSFLSLYTQLV